MSKKIIKEQYMNSILTESYESVPRTEGDPVIAKFNILMTEEATQNKNGRVYPEAAWNQYSSFAKGGKYLNEDGSLKQLKLLGNLDHPSDGNSEVLLDQAAITWHTANRTVNENGKGVWDGEVHVLDTPKGRIVKTFLEYAKRYGGGEAIGVSSRAFGDTVVVESANGIHEEIVPETFELISFDFVYDPSVANANNPSLLESTKRNRIALLEGVKELAKQDKDNEEVYNNFISDYILESNKGITTESVLDTAKKEYIDKLRKQENQVYNSIYQLENMTEEEFAETDLASKFSSRQEMLNKLQTEFNKVNLEIKKLKAGEELAKVKQDITENTKQAIYDLRKGEQAEDFKKYLRDRGLYFEPSENGNHVTFVVNGADEFVDQRAQDIVNPHKDTYIRLSTILQDLRYMANHGKGAEKYLTVDSNLEKTIAEIRRLLNSLSDEDKPEWLSVETINNLEKELKAIKYDGAKGSLEHLTESTKERTITENEEDLETEIDLDELESDLEDAELEDEVNELEDEEDDLESELDTEEDELDELEDEEDTELSEIEELTHQVKELRAIVEDLFDLFMPLDEVDVEIIDPEDAELAVGDELLDDEFALTDEEIAELSDEDLDFLLQLDGEMI